METPRILIVDDDAPTRTHLDQLVHDLCATQTLLAASGAEASALIADTSIALAILDVDLGAGPGGKFAGLELLTQLNQRCPVIVVSGMQEETFLMQVSLALHAWDFIGKPIDDSDFLNKVRHALDYRIETNPDPPTDNSSSLPKGLSYRPNRRPDLMWQGKPVRLTITQLRLVHALIEQPGVVVDAQRLVRALDTGEVSTLHNHLMGIRKRFRDVDLSFNKIRTEAGKGYAWDADP